MRLCLFHGLSIAGSVLLGISPARAETPPPTSDEAVALEDPSIVGGEVIEIWDERPDKPFDRDTQQRLSGAELLEKGATNLAEALELLPDIYVRESGRGGRQIDIRAARKGSIKVLIDGVAVDDPFYGNLDLTAIPVTDIVQIRVSSSPASPIDGTGGPGGVIEVHTRDAVGVPQLQARLQGSTLKSADAAATGRMMLGPHLALRVSATGALGMRDFSVAMPDDSRRRLDEQRQQAAGAIRLEYRRGKRRVVGDLWAQHRGFMVPPGEDGQMDILIVDGETAARASIAADQPVGAMQLRGRAYLHGLTRDSSYYADASLGQTTRTETLDAYRLGLSLLGNRPLRKTMQLVASASLDSEGADVGDMDGDVTGGRATTASLATGLQWESGPWKLDSAGGVAVPIGLGAAPWPELKFTGELSPRDRPVSFKVTGARKGRTPTLRERFRLDIGNRELGPEHAWFGEVAVALQPIPAVEVQAASYHRRSTGLVRFDPDTARLMNTGKLTIRGIETRFEARPTGFLRTGASWNFTDAYSAALGTRPLDFLPNHRIDGWLGANHRRVGAAIRVRFVGDQIDRNTTLPSRTTAELSAHGRLNDFVGTIRVGNLWDQEYLLRAGGVRAPGRFVSFSLHSTWR